MSVYNLPNSAGIYAKSDGVKAITADKVADYTGAAGMNIAVEHAVAYGQNMFPQEIAMTQLNATISYSGVYWAVDNILTTLLGVSGTAGSVMDSTAATATIWKLDNTISALTNYEYLSSWTRSSDSKKFGIWAAAGRLASDLGMSVSKDEFSTTEMGITAYADVSGDIIWFWQEN
jgi:hypothetical protein